MNGEPEQQRAKRGYHLEMSGNSKVSGQWGALEELIEQDELTTTSYEEHTCYMRQTSAEGGRQGAVTWRSS